MDVFWKLGEEMVGCDLNCKGMTCAKREGIIPRGFLLETRDADEKKCIIVWLNPGKCSEKERAFYIERGNTFQSTLDFFSNGHKEIPYFKRTRHLLDMLGYKGNILRTNLAKCECSGENGDIPIQTLRTCINKYLRKEVTYFDADVIFALGNVAYDFCALSFPDKCVIGVPHPTGSHGHFLRLIKKMEESPEKYRKILQNKKDEHGNYIALRLSDI